MSCCLEEHQFTVVLHTNKLELFRIYFNVLLLKVCLFGTHSRVSYLLVVLLGFISCKVNNQKKFWIVMGSNPNKTYIKEVCRSIFFTTRQETVKNSFSNGQNFPFQTVKINFFKLSKFSFSNCRYPTVNP